MKPLYATLITLLIALSVRSQPFMITAGVGTYTYGTYTITITGSGATCLGGGSTCFAPTANQFWIACGSTLGTYSYTLNKPIYYLEVLPWGINGGPSGLGEYMAMTVNGAPYSLTTSNVISYTACGASVPTIPCYISAGTWMGPLGATTNYNGGDFFICGPLTSFSCSDPGTVGGVALFGIAYAVLIDTLPITGCAHAVNNGPCVGDTLLLDMQGDSTGATYLWSGPGGFTSTLQNPFIFPAVFADSGLYTVIKANGAVFDTSTTYVIIHPLPVVNATNNSPLCLGLISTLDLAVSPDSVGEAFLWKGPLGFTSTLQNPTRTFGSVDTGIYHVYATTVYGCKDSGTTHVIGIPQPTTPHVSDENYCQGLAFVPYAITDTIGGDTVLWYTVGTGGTGSTTPITVNTAIPGMYYVWVSEKLGNCESLRGEDSVRVTTTPPAPGVTGTMQYCQFVGPVIPLTVTTTPTGVAKWYYSATGTTFTTMQPLADITIAGTYNWWVSQIDSGCEGPRVPVTVVVHPKPQPPFINPTPICQFRVPIPVSCSPDTVGVGTTLLSPNPFLWYGPGITPGMSTPPIPGTNVAPDTIVYYVTETTIYGCVSDSAVDIDVIKVKPPVPATKNINYCQYASTVKLNALVDSIGNSHLNWYYNSTALPPTPSPFTDTLPGTYTWYVSQTVPDNSTGCESDSAAVSATIIYKPVFDIAASPQYVCQYDSLTLSYNALGPALFAPGYRWVLPVGAFLAANTNLFDSTITVAFDSANMNNYVHLYTSDDSGFCVSDTSIYIKVVAQPYMSAVTKADVCLGDTVQLGLSTAASDAYTFSWFIDNTPLMNSSAIKFIVGSSNSGGPYKISWVDTGLHIIKVSSQSSQGCQSPTSYDSVHVHQLPNAEFGILSVDSANEFCIQDSVHFLAASINYNYSYAWAPADYFSNINKPDIWGKMESAASTVTLTVTDPYGCYATSSQTLYPGTCCTVIFPNAFTPGGTINKLFRPIMTGFHSFHEFRIVNRWGTTVFEGGNTNVSWDGNYNGVPQDMGTYFYYMKYDCGGKTIEAKGDVTLIR